MAIKNKRFSLPINNFEITNNNPDFLFVELQCICEGQNLNDTVFLLDGMEKCKDSFKGKPLMCSFPSNFMDGSYKIGDGHNSSDLQYDKDKDTYYYSYLDGSDERCVGYILPDSNIDIKDINGRKWIIMTALIFKKYNYELVKDILNNKENKQDLPKDMNGQKRISVEVEVTNSYEENNLEYLVSWIGDGITILNDDVKEGIAGANLQVYADSKKFKKYSEVLTFQYNKYKKEEITNFPKQGDNKEISLDNSNYKLFDIKYAENLKNNYPTIWQKGGNIRGNQQFDTLLPIAKRQNKQCQNKKEEKAIKLRESWIPRHYKDYLINGVVAQIKWLAIGSKGEKYMKDLIDKEKEKIDKKDNKKVNQEVFQSLSMNELSKSIQETLNQYTYDDKQGWSCYLYYINDITDNEISVYNYENCKEYIIPYYVGENKEVCLDMENMKELDVKDINSHNFSLIKFIAKDKMGTKEKIEIDKSKDSLSDDAWGDVDKSQLKKECLMASNWETVCKAVFAQLLDGYKDGKEGSLKYPIMQKKGNKVVYNKGALASALTYAKANNESQVVATVTKIRNKLGLNEEENKEDNKKMESYIEQAKKCGYAFIGVEKGQYVFAKEKKCDKDGKLCGEEKMSLYEVPVEEASKKDKEFKAEELKEKSLKMEEDLEAKDKKDKESKDDKDKKEDKKEDKKNKKEKNDDGNDEDYKVKCEDLQKKCDKLEEAHKQTEKDCNDMKEKCKKLEEDYTALKDKEFAKNVQELFSRNLDLSEEDVNDLNERIKKNEFSYDIEKLKKEIAYKQFQKKEKEDHHNLSYALNQKINNNGEQKDDIDDLCKRLGGK